MNHHYEHTDSLMSLRPNQQHAKALSRSGIPAFHSAIMSGPRQCPREPLACSHWARHHALGCLSAGPTTNLPDVSPALRSGGKPRSRVILLKVEGRAPAMGCGLVANGEITGVPGGSLLGGTSRGFGFWTSNVGCDLLGGRRRVSSVRCCIVSPRHFCCPR
jgi:hypothetical protein